MMDLGSGFKIKKGWKDYSILKFLSELTKSQIIPIRYSGKELYLLDQRLLPKKIKWLCIKNAYQGINAIANMVVRGAPAIGITGAFSLVLAARSCLNKKGDFISNLKEAGDKITKARPTAVNLKWAIDRLLSQVDPALNPKEIVDILEQEALKIWEEDIAANIKMAAFGQKLLPDPVTVLTHCNAGALATGAYGTALGVIRGAKDAGKRIKVFADETRPWLQGARLTAWELLKDNIDCQIIIDSAAAFIMQQGMIDAVIVGADRIAANGDVANKIGTYSVALAAKENDIPFYVAAPSSTLDINTPTGKEIPIEIRDEKEITHIGKTRVATEGVKALNFAFDITPNRLITAIITEKGVLRPPFGPAISNACTV